MTDRPTTSQQPRFDPERTALIVIDPVNDFLHEDGAAWALTKSTVHKNDVVAQLRRVTEGARSAGVPVLFGPMAYTEEDYADRALQRRTGINRLMFETRMFLAGSFGADFHAEVQPVEGDIILEPHKGSDVFETDLPQHLERLGTTHLVLAGMTANLCVEGTGRHAAERGYDVTFLSDAIGAAGLPAYEAAIHVNFPLVGNAVLEVDEFLACIGPSSDSTVLAQLDDTVVGSDRGEIGSVSEVVQPQDGEPGYLVVRRGVIFDKETYIPLDAITHRVEDRVFVNIPKLLVPKLPWDQRPTRQDLEARTGAPADQVQALYRSHGPTGAPGTR